MQSAIPTYPSTRAVNCAPRPLQGASPSTRARGISDSDDFNQGQRAALRSAYYLHSPPQRRRGASGHPRRGRSFVQNQQVNVRDPQGTGTILVAFVLQDTTAYDQAVPVVINGRRVLILNDPHFIR